MMVPSRTENLGIKGLVVIVCQWMAGLACPARLFPMVDS